MTKIISFYLPQFHEIPENNEWWGKGFTEWTNVNKAEKKYSWHLQPKKPLNNNYYNLTDDDVHKWQIDLAKKHGIYGFCYYHYWFNGKKLLEKPIELVRDNRELDFNYCLCWANEPWTRSWDGKTKEILMEQSYGQEEDWENQFNYLLSFFNDKRYIKIDDMPIYIIYRTQNIDNIDKIIEFWNKLALKNGLKGIYIIEMKNSFQNTYKSKKSRALIEFEPMNTLIYKVNILKVIYWQLLKKMKRDLIVSYDYIWEKIIRNKNNIDKKIFLGGFVNWDNSPRRKNAATIFKGATPKKFEYYFKLLLKKAEKENSEYIFVNAWNEWAEGTYLEPDEEYGFGYLEAIKNALNKE